MNPGKNFENNFSKSVPDDIYCLRIKDSASSFSPNSKSRFTSNNPFDFLVFYDGILFPLELKSTKYKSFSIQTSEEEKNKEIKYHQIQSLKEANKYENIISGFILDFRENKTYWIYIEDFLLFLKENNKKSINTSDIEKYNGIEISKKKLRINYRYDIKKMIIDIQKTREEKNGKKNSI